MTPQQVATWLGRYYERGRRTWYTTETPGRDLGSSTSHPEEIITKLLALSDPKQKRGPGVVACLATDAVT